EQPVEALAELTGTRASAAPTAHPERMAALFRVREVPGLALRWILLMLLLPQVFLQGGGMRSTQGSTRRTRIRSTVRWKGGEARGRRRLQACSEAFHVVRSTAGTMGREGERARHNRGRTVWEGG